MSESRLPYYPVSLRPGADLDEQLATRGDSAGRTMKRDLLRYYRLCTSELERMNFTEREVGVLYELMSTTNAHDASELLSGPLWARVSDAMDHNRVRSHHHLADPNQLIEKLRRLTPGGVFAVVDALERSLLCRIRTQSRESMGKAWRDLGLVRDDSDNLETEEPQKARREGA